MANIREVAKSIHYWSKTQENSNPVREFSWVLQQTVQEDLSQVEKIFGEANKLGLLAHAMIYIQRMIEIGYIFTEVYVRNEYESWQPSSDSPRVIDLGGDPGAMSALYWKYKAPQAHITIVEANPATANVLQKNLERRGIDDIEVINAAVAGDDNENVMLHLHRPGKGFHTQDFVEGQNVTGSSNQYTVEVPKVKLSTLIREGERIDLLKVDIEGSEGDAIRELAQSGKLQQVNQIIMEFHHEPIVNPQNSLLEMLNILQAGGFTIDEAHITEGKGLRNKMKVNTDNISDIASINEQVFLTFSAKRIDYSNN